MGFRNLSLLASLVCLFAVAERPDITNSTVIEVRPSSGMVRKRRDEASSSLEKDERGNRTAAASTWEPPSSGTAQATASCTPWPAAPIFGCTETGGAWMKLGNKSTTGFEMCENLCLTLTTTYASCCFWRPKLGCFIKIGASVTTGTGQAVQCQSKASKEVNQEHQLAPAASAEPAVSSSPTIDAAVMPQTDSSAESMEESPHHYPRRRRTGAAHTVLSAEEADSASKASSGDLDASAEPADSDNMEGSDASSKLRHPEVPVQVTSIAAEVHEAPSPPPSPLAQDRDESELSDVGATGAAPSLPQPPSGSRDHTEPALADDDLPDNAHSPAEAATDEKREEAEKPETLQDVELKPPVRKKSHGSAVEELEQHGFSILSVIFFTYMLLALVALAAFTAYMSRVHGEARAESPTERDKWWYILRHGFFGDSRKKSSRPDIS